MKSSFLKLCVFFFIVLLFVSCENKTPVKENIEETAPEDAAKVSLAIAFEKTLESDTNRDIKYWEFMATPLFKLHNDEKVYGTVSYWRPLDELNTGNNNVVKTACDLGRYTAGEWLFELRSLNSEHHVISVGKTTQIVRSGIDNVINIVMHNDIADDTHGNSKDTTSRFTQKTNSSATGVETIEEFGKVHIGFSVNMLDVNPDNLSIVLTKQKINANNVLSFFENVTTDWTYRVSGEPYTRWFKEATVTNYKDKTGNSSELVEEGRMYWETIVSNVEAGAYVYTITIMATNTSGTRIPIAGQSVALYVIGGEETQIKGTLLANEHILQSLKINKTGKIYGSINGKDAITDCEEASDSTLPVKLEFKQTEDQKNDSAEEISSFVWIADGKILEGETDSVLNFSCPKITIGEGADAVEKLAYGIHRVVCIAIGEQGSLGKASLDVIFNPPEGPNPNGEEYPWPDDVLHK